MAGQDSTKSGEPAVRIEGLSKRYRLSEVQAGIAPLPSLVPARLRRGGEKAKPPSHLWALRDLSLDVPSGSVLGIIGENGSGKTTLLRILARMTAPTSGRAIVRGRTLPMLYTSTGLLEPTMEARRNCFLLARYLGIPRSLVEQKVDAIFDFAELTDHRDKLLKHYSGGMMKRLAFSITVNLDPQVLLADDRLLVGDLAFQQRALERFRGVAAEESCTVLFASHDLELLGEICTDVLWLRDGQLAAYGTADEILPRYEAEVPKSRRQWRQGADDVDLDDEVDDEDEGFEDERRGAPAPRTGRGRRRKGGRRLGLPTSGRILRTALLTEAGEAVSALAREDEAELRIEAELDVDDVEIRGHVHLRLDGEPAYRIVQPYRYHVDRKGPVRLTVLLPARVLRGGTYDARMGVRVYVGEEPESLASPAALRFEVESSDGDATGFDEDMADDELVDDDLGADDSTAGRSRRIDRPLLDWIVEPVPAHEAPRSA